MRWPKAFGIAAKVTAVVFAVFTALIGQGFTAAVEPDAGALDQISWVLIGVVLFAGLFFAPNAARRGWMSRLLVALAMAPATVMLFRILMDVVSRPGPGLALVFSLGLATHVIAYLVLGIGTVGASGKVEVSPDRT